MTTLTEKPHAGSFILSMSGDGNLSIDYIVVASGAGVLYPGSVLGVITASGKYVLCDPAATDGSQNAAAILYDRVDATSADAPAVAVTRHAEVYLSGLIWKSGMNATAQAAAITQLAAALIVAR
jgi:hypothetical protein